MVVCILYVQANERIAQTIKDQMLNDEIEFLVAESAKDAFAIYEERKILLTLVDANITDMKLRDFVDACCLKYPDMLMNVCMDVPDVKYITGIAGRKNIKKIFLPPWDVEDIVTGLKETIDGAYIANDFARRRQELADEEEVFENTLAKLKESLIRQQYSYNKIAPFFNKCLEIFATESRYDIEVKKFVILTCSKALKLGTTVKLSTMGFGDFILQNVQEGIAGNKDVSIVSIDSCLMGEAAKHVLARIVLCNWMLSYLSAHNDTIGKIISSESAADNSIKTLLSIDSRYFSTDVISYEFSVEYKGLPDGYNEALSNGEESCYDTMLSYVENVLTIFTEQYERFDTEKGFKYVMRFKLF